jgi:AmmeMemoRadiSam system protein B
MEKFFRLAERVRSPIVEGIFYPKDKAEILARLSGSAFVPGRGDQAVARIAPHGAWEISGSILEDAFSAAAGRTGAKSPLRIVLMGPVHNTEEEGIFLSDSRFFSTPLGDIPVDQEINRELASRSSLFEINDIPHLREHSLEVLLPFIKYGFPGAKIVPLLMGKSGPMFISALARTLRLVFEPLLDSTLLVISSNLSIDTGGARSLGQAEESIRLLLEKDAGAFIDGLAKGRLRLCGGGLLAGLLESGLLDSLGAKLLTKPLLKGLAENGKTVYFGALSYEQLH